MRDPKGLNESKTIYGTGKRVFYERHPRKFIGPIQEGQERTDNIIGYRYFPECRIYAIGLCSPRVVIFRLCIKLTTEHRSRGIRLTLLNKKIIDYQPDRHLS